MTKKVVLELTPEMYQVLDNGEEVEESDAAEEFSELYGMLDTLIGKKVLLVDSLEFIRPDGKRGEDVAASAEEYGTIYGYTYCHIYVEGPDKRKYGVGFQHGLTLNVVMDEQEAAGQ